MSGRREGHCHCHALEHYRGVSANKSTTMTGPDAVNDRRPNQKREAAEEEWLGEIPDSETKVDRSLSAESRGPFNPSSAAAYIHNQPEHGNPCIIGCCVDQNIDGAGNWP